MKIHGHPAHHGHHQSPACTDTGEHRYCTGFSGGYDTWICGCCCHDEQRGEPLSDEDRQVIQRLRSSR